MEAPLSSVSPGPGDSHTPKRKWWLRYVRDRRIVAAALTAFAAALGVVRSLLDLFNRRC
jgi:hypothetical protein